MAKKKGTKKKKKKGAKKGGKKASALGAETQEEIVPAFVQHYVTIHFKLVNWSFLDFSMEVCVNTTKLYSLKRKIKERHGRISNLRVYHGSMQPQTEMKEEMWTIEQYGIEGEPKSISNTGTSPREDEEDDDPNTAEIIFWYDFKPFPHNDPLLLR